MRNGFALALMLGLAACGRAPSVLSERTTLQGEIEGVVVAVSAIGDAGAVERDAKAMCARESYCWLLGYRSRTDMPAYLPSPGNGPPLFSYVKNLDTGLDRALFDCRVFKGLSDERCIATTADTEQRESPAP